MDRSTPRVAGMEIPTRVGMDRSRALSPRLSPEIPTRVGMDRVRRSSRPPVSKRSPRAWGWTGRGGGLFLHERSPRAWGWTAQGWASCGHRIPTRVGMDRWSIRSALVWRRSPRAWGRTESANVFTKTSEIPTRVGMDREVPAHGWGRSERSPRAWGWTDEHLLAVEVVGIRDPHARGDGPRALTAEIGDDRRSPRAWGWTEGLGPPDGDPHARGDGP